MNFMNETFENTRVELHGNSYHNCTFKKCELVYDGDRSPTFYDNEYLDSIFVFTGSALRTLYFLGNMYQAGDGGKEIVEKTFADLKDQKIHGHEVRTTRPHTQDSSLSKPNLTIN